MTKLRSLKKRLKLGQDVEMEHGKVDPETDVIGKDKKKARKIALAHIKEIPDYYRRLRKMEKKGKKEWGIKEASHEAVMALRRRQGVPPGTGYDVSKLPPTSALVTKKHMKDRGELTAGYRDNLINALVEWAMVWGAAPPPNPEKQIAKIRKYLSEGVFTRKDKHGFSGREHRKFAKHHAKYTGHLVPKQGYDGVDKYAALEDSDAEAQLKWGSKVGRRYGDWNQKHGERLIDQRFGKPLR